ncbi:MAG: amidase [Pseudomonadota bacterium]
MREQTTHLVPGTNLKVLGLSDGPLQGLTFMAKDLFDVAGYVTGAGNPDWARTHPAAQTNAWVVQSLLDAGADLTGKTMTDEISLGFFGENAFYGTPLNPRAPDKVPGGSSSGSASAVAQGICDFALGTDTGGSVRIPASYCGLYGLRPTHGRLSVQGMLPQAPSSDTLGWFARDATTMGRIAETLFEAPISKDLPTQMVVAVDMFDYCDAAVRDALQPALARLGEVIRPSREVTLAPDGITVWARAQRDIQLAEAWETFGDWVNAENPCFAYLVSRALQYGASVSASELNAASEVRMKARQQLKLLTPSGTVLCLPTAPGIAPRKGESLETLGETRDRINCACCLGGLAGHPQLNLPLAEVDGAPVGLSIVAGRGEDMALIAVAKAMEEVT